MYDFWLPPFGIFWPMCCSPFFDVWLLITSLWYLLTNVLFTLLWCMTSDCPFGIFWPMCCSPFFDVWLLITSLWYLLTTFNNISAISWRSVLLVEETGGSGENHCLISLRLEFRRNFQSVLGCTCRNWPKISSESVFSNLISAIVGTPLSSSSSYISS